MARNPRQDAGGPGRRYGDHDAPIERIDGHQGSGQGGSGQDGAGREAQAPTQIPKQGWMAIAKRTVAEVKDDNVVLLAAGVAFYFFLALFPALIAMVTVYGLVMSPEQVQSQLQELAAALPSNAASLITDQVRAATSSAGGGLTIGLIVSLAAVLWAASGGMNGLIKGINVAYDEDESRNFFIKRGLAILLTLGGILFFAVAVALVAVLPAVLGSLGLGSIGQTVASIARWPLLALLMVVALAVVYRFAPDRDNPRFRWASWGAVVATVLWLIGSGLFSLYINNFGSYNETYGALAGVIVLMLWLQLTSFVVLFGAEMNSEMEHQTAQDTTTGESRPMGERDARMADSVAGRDEA